MDVRVSQNIDESGRLSDLLKSFLRKVRGESYEEAARKTHQKRRVDVFHDKLNKEVQARISSSVSDPDARAQLMRIAQGMYRNPLKEITKVITRSVYLNPPQRIITGPRGQRLNNTERKNWESFLESMDADHRFRQLLQYAFSLNSVLAYPRVVEHGGTKRIKIETILPHMADVVLDPEDSERVAIFGWQDFAGNTILADDEAVYTFNRETLLGVSYHGLGENPVSVFRLGYPEEDFWSTYKNLPLLETSISIGLAFCLLERTRQHQYHLQPVFNGDMMTDAIKTIGLDPIVNTTEENVTSQVLDLDLDPSNHIKTIEFLLAQLAESFGLDSRSLNYGRDQNVASLAPVFLKVEEVRKEMTPWIIKFEKDVIRKSAKMAELEGLPNAVPAKKVQDGFFIAWEPLTYPLSPLEQMQIDEQMLSWDQIDTVDIMLRNRPGMTESDVEALIAKKAKRNDDDRERKAKRNLPGMDPDKTLPANQGTIGGLLSAEKRKEKEEDS